jgi:hypothetical protein
MFIYDILASDLNSENSNLSCQLGIADSGEVVSENNEIWSPSGLASRPAIVQTPSDNSAQAIAIPFNDTNIIIGVRDSRYQKIYGQLAPGETCLFAVGDGSGQARVLLKANGTINLYTRKTESDPGIGVFVNPQTDTISIINSVGVGINITPDGISLNAPGSTLLLGKDAKLISTGKTQIDGANVVLGSSVAPVVNSAVIGASGLSGRASLKCLIE